ncbi:MAG: hypothetical protein ACR2MG_08930 [Pyrinomonadaceae bacterium]
MVILLFSNNRYKFMSITKVTQHPTQNEELILSIDEPSAKT